jgi:hypothetical protein
MSRTTFSTVEDTIYRAPMPTSVGKQLKQYNLFYAAYYHYYYCDFHQKGLMITVDCP